MADTFPIPVSSSHSIDCHLQVLCRLHTSWTLSQGRKVSGWTEPIREAVFNATPGSQVFLKTRPKMLFLSFQRIKSFKNKLQPCAVGEGFSNLIFPPHLDHLSLLEMDVAAELSSPTSARVSARSFCCRLTRGVKSCIIHCLHDGHKV